jgi:hypothetical protein
MKENKFSNFFQIQITLEKQIRLIKYLTRWLKERFILTLIGYSACILLLQISITRTGSGIAIGILKNQTQEF